MPALYVVATPIGNLEDITLRAIRTLKEVILIAAEDTRVTRKLLAHYDIQTPTTSYHEHNKLTKLDFILGQLKSGNIALVSDAGMPGVSDPGFELISAVIRQNIPVIPIPGPSVTITALAISGLPVNNFHYLGFLPHKAGERRRVLKSIRPESNTLVFFESPHRVSESLKDLLEILGDRKAVICRELTKIHEEVFRGTLSQALVHFVSPKGEFTMIIAGNPQMTKPEMNQDIQKRIYQMQKSGFTAKKAVPWLSEETGLSKRALYQAWIKNK